jgi:hypothetical protein
MRYRLSRAWPLDHGRELAPSGTVIDSNSDDDWSRLARGLTPPWDVQALDDECYQLLFRAYPGHRHLIGPPPRLPGRANRRSPNQNQTNKHARRNRSKSSNGDCRAVPALSRQGTHQAEGNNLPHSLMLSDDLAPQQNGMFDFRLGSTSAVPSASTARLLWLDEQALRRQLIRSCECQST